MDFTLGQSCFTFKKIVLKLTSCVQAGVHSSLKLAPHELKIKDAVQPPRMAAHKHSQSETYPPPHPYYYGYPPHPVYSPSYYGLPVHLSPSSRATLKQGRDHNIPSSNSFVPEEVLTIYPWIDEWLSELDSGECGADEQGWPQYAVPLNKNGYTHIIWLIDDVAKDLAKMTGMPIGIAKLLIKYAKTDSDRITRREKRARTKVE